MRFLVTGGAGFIGSHLAERLISEGHSVSVIDNLSTGSLDNIENLLAHPNFKFAKGDILNIELLESLFKGTDVVVHLAAAVGVRLILDKPIETIITNVHGTENILKLTDEYGKRVLLASTSEVYGKRMDGDISLSMLKENDDWMLGPTTVRRWAYACSKALDEFLGLAYYYEKGLPVIIVRIFNTIGPRQMGRYGMVVPNLVKQALQGEPLTVFGDGEQTRCFTYVQDTLNAMMGLMENLQAVGQVFNVGSEEEVSINELARRIIRLLKSESSIIHIPYLETYGPGFEDMQRRTPDICKINALTGYQPQTSLDDAIMSIADYFRKREETNEGV